MVTARRLVLKSTITFVLLGCIVLLTGAERSGKTADGSSWTCPSSESKFPAPGEKCPSGKLFCNCGGSPDGPVVWYNIECLNAFPLGCGIPKGEPDCVRFRKCAVCNDETTLTNEACASCVPGFQGGDCYQDINECLVTEHGCEFECQNVIGSFYCSCGTGYIVGTNEKNCSDIDECAVNNGGCSDNCTNTDGSYNCLCDAGYTLDSNMHSCIDMDECAVEKGGCMHSCNNTVGSYSCDCEPGYNLDPDQRGCADLDECNLLTHNCQQNCVNVIGSYRCSCFPGFKLELDGRACTELKWCLEPSVKCDHNCIDSPGTYVCTCRTGYTLADNKVVCKDDDECRESNGGCAQNCVNTMGSFECSCFDGFVLSSNSVCSDVDECENGTSDCGQNCTNTLGSYICSCMDGYLMLSDHRNCLKFKQGQTSLSEGPEGFVSMQLATGESHMQEAYTICETRPDGIKEKEATVICRSMKFVSGSAVSNPGKHDSKAMFNHLMYGRDLECEGDEEDLFQCNVDLLITNCTTQLFPAVSCHKDKDMLQRLRVGNRSSLLMIPEMFLNNSWHPVFFENFQAASVGCRLVGYDMFLYSNSSTPPFVGKIGLSCTTSDYSTIDECDVVALTQQPTYKCLFSDQLLFEIYPPEHGFGDEGLCLNHEGQEHVSLEIWSCASVALRVFDPQQKFEKYYEIRLDPFDLQKHSKNPQVSLWECVGNCSLKASSKEGRSFTCEYPYEPRQRVLTNVTIKFSANSLGISTSLQGHTRTEDALPSLVRQIVWPVKPELSQLPCLAVGNSKHEMIVKVFRRKGLNQCLYNLAIDLMMQCGDSFVDHTLCIESGCCWLKDMCYIPRYTTYLGSYDGASSKWREAFNSPPTVLPSNTEHLAQTIQMCLDGCRNDSYHHAAIDDLHCRCGNGRLSMLTKAGEHTTEAYALFDTFYGQHWRNLRPLRQNLGEVTLTTNSPQMVNAYAEVVLLVSNFPPNRVTMEVSAGGEYDQFVAWQGPKSDASWMQPNHQPTYCQSQNSLCSLVLRNSYEKPGNYTITVRFRGLLPTETFNVSTVFSVQRKESLSEILGNVVFVNNGPSYPGRSIQFLLAFERVSPDLQVIVYFADDSRTSVVDAKSPNATLPGWALGTLLGLERKRHVLQFSHVYDMEGDHAVNASCTDSMWDASNEAVNASTIVTINSFLKLVGNFFVLNNGPLLKGYNITFVLMAESIVPQVTIKFNPGNGEVPYSVSLQENTNLPDFVLERVEKVSSVEDWKSYPSFTAQHGYPTSGSYMAEAVLSNSIRIHSSVIIVSLARHIGRVRFFTNTPVLVNRKVTFVFCLQSISPNMQIDIDFGDETSMVLTVPVSNTTTLPTWAMELLSKIQATAIESIYRAVFVHTYATAATYRARITISDKQLTEKTDSVEVPTNVEVQSLENFLGQTLFSSSSPSNLERIVMFFLCFERFAENISTVIDPNDGLPAKPVAVQRERTPEMQRLFSSALRGAPCAYVGATLHTYTTVGDYKAIALISESENPEEVVTMTTNVVIECQVAMRVDVGSYKQKQRVYPIDRNAYAEFFVRIDSDCMNLPAEYQWYVLSTQNRIELDPSKGQEVRLPYDVPIDNAVLAIPPRVLTQSYYVVAVEVRVWSGDWMHSWIDSVIVEVKEKALPVDDKKEGGSVGIQSQAHIPVEEVDVLSNITLDGNAVINSDSAYPSDGLAYRWFCTPAGQYLPDDVFTDPVPSVDGCFGHGLFIGNTSALEFSALTLIHIGFPADFTFHLYLTDQNSTILMLCGYIVRLVALTNLEVPRVAIFCKINCDSQLRAEQEVALVAYCMNCLVSESVGYTWDVLPTSSLCTIQFFDWKRNSLTGDGESYIIINPNVFITNRDEVYEVTVTVTRLMSKESGSASVFISPTPIT